MFGRLPLWKYLFKYWWRIIKGMGTILGCLQSVGGNKVTKHYSSRSELENLQNSNENEIFVVVLSRKRAKWAEWFDCMAIKMVLVVVKNQAAGSHTELWHSSALPWGLRVTTKAVSLQAGGAGVGDSCKRLLSVIKAHTNTPAIWHLTVSPELLSFALSALESS